MMQKQYDHYTDLSSYAKEVHEKNRKRIRASGIVLLILPIVLGLIRWMTDSDKFTFLIIWVMCMFVLSAYLVSVEYMDHVLQKRLMGLGDNHEDYDSLVDGQRIIPAHVKDNIRTRLDSETTEEVEEGGDE